VTWINSPRIIPFWAGEASAYRGTIWISNSLLAEKLIDVLTLFLSELNEN
jgi:hypothetical protein